MIMMVIHQGETKHRIRALLDTGCSLALINIRTRERLGLRQQKHQRLPSIENYTGESVPRAGQFYTEPL